jgi:hypothetical protein
MQRWPSIFSLATPFPGIQVHALPYFATLLRHLQLIAGWTVQWGRLHGLRSEPKPHAGRDSGPGPVRKTRAVLLETCWCPQPIC